MTWHVDPVTLDAYESGTLDDVLALSVEAHVGSCGLCRAELAERFDEHRGDVIWSGVVDAIDRPRALPGERALTGLGVPAHLARLLTSVPAARLSGFVAAALVLGLAAVLPRAILDGRLAFLVLAPLAPVAGIALAYGKGVDPLYELAVSSPTGGFRLVLVRSAVVLSFSTAASALVSLAVPGVRGGVLWLLPSLALTLLTLALSATLSSNVAAGVAASAWFGGVLVVARLSHRSEAAFGPWAQAGFASMIGVLIVLLAVRRRSFEQI